MIDYTVLTSARGLKEIFNSCHFSYAVYLSINISNYNVHNKTPCLLFILAIKLNSG